MSLIEHMERSGPRGVGIVAFGSTKSLVNWESPDWMYWSMNDSYNYFAKRIWALFEMHPASHYTDPRHYIPDHEARMAKMGRSVWLAFPNPNIPNASIYPLNDVVRAFGHKYFTSTITFMIPFAILKIEESLARRDGIFAPRIGLWGCDMALSSEYARERSCTEYWLGRAEQRGIEIVIPEQSPLLKANYVYGYDTVLIEDRRRVIEARRIELSEQLAAARQNDRVANDRVSGLEGMLSEVSFFEAHMTDEPPTGEAFR